MLRTTLVLAVLLAVSCSVTPADAAKKTVIIREGENGKQVIVRRERDDGTVVIRRKFEGANGQVCRSRTVRDDSGSRTVRECNF